MASSSEYRGHSNTPVVCTRDISQDSAPLRILIDWVGFTFKLDTTRILEVLQWFEDYLGIEREWFKQGRRNYEGYASSLVFENINIYYQGSSNQGIHVDFTGQGCRFLDYHYQKLRVQDKKLHVQDQKPRVHNWYDLLQLLYLDQQIKFTRLDIAVDDHHGYCDIMTMFEKSLKGEMTMRFRSWTPFGKFDSFGKSHGLTLYYGSDDSDIQLVVYEKNKQLKLDYFWTRFELRLKQNYVRNFVADVLHNKDIPLGVHAAGILKNYLTFREPQEKDSNRRRWPVSPWWNNFLAGVPPLKIASQLPDRSILKSKKWLSEQVSRTIARLFFAYQDISNDWLRDIMLEGTTKLDQEDLRMIEEFRRLYGKDAQKILKEHFPIAEEKEKESSCHEDSRI